MPPARDLRGDCLRENLGKVLAQVASYGRYEVS
jgi:hypothetical protein